MLISHLCSTTPTTTEQPSLISHHAYKSKMLILFVALILFDNANARIMDDYSLVELHEDWMARHGRVYATESEKAKRFQIYKENLDYIKRFNEGTNHPYHLGLNEFADMTNEEFVALRTGMGYTMDKAKGTGSTTSVTSTFTYANVTDDVPLSMDWREMGAVTDAKDQGSCGSCWAFATVAVVESLHHILTGDLISLSAQELVDCDSINDDGCRGGWAESAFDFILQNHGLTTEFGYPYRGNDGTCDVDKLSADGVVSISGYARVPVNSESSLLNAVANQPVAASMDANGPSFQFYAGGVYTGEDCGTALNHYVTVVGYGETDDGIQYWLVKNSWGMGWGQNGYGMIKRNTEADGGTCGILMRASYPTAA